MIAAMQKHLSEMQDKAVEATSLVLALDNVLGFPAHNDIAVSLTRKIANLTDSINDGLDSVEIGHVIAAATETPVTKAYRDWKKYRDWLHSGTDGLPDEKFDDLCDTRRDMERKMFKMPSRDLQDAVLKLMAFTDCGNDFASDGDCTGERLMQEIATIIAQQVERPRLAEAA